MQIQFNYRYYVNPDDFETHHASLEQFVTKRIAMQLSEVQEVVRFAEYMQKRGYYVALYLPYESARAFNPEMTTVTPPEGYVYAAAYIFDSIQYYDGEFETSPHEPQQQFTFQLSDDVMQDHIQRVQDAIVEGNTYQVNYTTRLTDTIRQPIADLYYALLAKGHGNYAALFDTDEVKVASFSPELFFQKGSFEGRPNTIVSKPMKGTAPRATDEAEDEANYQHLTQSKKDQAENVMIVDLLRNDIARIAQTGSVDVHHLFAIEAYETVYQMTSMVTGEVTSETSLNTIFQALFPCGSITGAPKLNTMRYIADLEQTPRYIYCGTLGLMLPSGQSIFNVPIRTVEYVDGQARYGVGAGITIDSDPVQEVQEFKDKTKILEQL